MPLSAVASSSPPASVLPEMPGLVGSIADYIYGSAPHPNRVISLVGALGLVSGFAGRSFSVGNAGLNNYFTTLAPSGNGKDAVASATSYLTSVIQKTVPSIVDFRGPGELVSGPGLLRWISKLPKPSIYCILGEFGLMMQTITKPNASPNMKSVMTVLMKAYSKSGRGEVLDASAYSDPEKKLPSINRPSITLMCEGTPETFYEALDPRLVTSGFLPRFAIFETDEPRAYRNLNRLIEPPRLLVEQLIGLVNECLMLAHSDDTRQVAMCPQADAHFVDFDRWTTDEINRSGSDVTKALWNRAALKAQKIAAVIAVGRNHIRPTIEMWECEWATNTIYNQTVHLIGKFERGETGSVEGDDEKQQNIVLRCLCEYATQPFDRFERYQVPAILHKQKLVTQSYLSRRVLSMPAFKHDRSGATMALKRTLSALVENGDLAELPRSQAATFGTHARCFALVNHKRILAACQNMN